MKGIISVDASDLGFKRRDKMESNEERLKMHDRQENWLDKGKDFIEWKMKQGMKKKKWKQKQEIENEREYIKSYIYI